MRKKHTALVALSLGAGLLFCSPSVISGYSLLGFSLQQSTVNYQRDHRVYNNFFDGVANDNMNPNANYPGALGAVLALWKGANGWNSNGGGGKDFDFDFQGEATSVGGLNANISSSLEGNCGGGTLAFTESPDSNGWRIRYCEEWVWEDGPSVPGGRIDIQGVATHEFGHALGMGHSQAGNCNGTCITSATMCPSICGTGTAQRSTETDDENGLGDIYGSIGGNKPLVTAISGSFGTGEVLTIDGMNFAATVNVKFTARTSTNGGTIPGVVYAVASQNGGTRVDVTIPAEARTGNVLVWQPGSGGLSNPFPIFIDEDPPSITSINPAMGPVRGGTSITITGTNFASDGDVFFEGVQVFPTSLTANEIIFDSLPGSAVGNRADISVVQPTGSDSRIDFFLFEDNQPSIEFRGNPVVGNNITITIYGPANASVAMVVAVPGSTEKLGFTFCVDRPFRFLKKFNCGLNTGPTGEVSVSYMIPNLVFQTDNMTGVLRLGGGTFVEVGCQSVTYLP
jgi:hypothetical protein